MILRHDAAAAIAFLAQLCPSGPWHLTAIKADPPPGENPTTRTFAPGEADKVSAFLSAYGDENIYFTLNTIAPARYNRKADKEHVLVAPWLHVDVDPRPRPTPWTEADLAGEVARIRATLEAPTEAPRPTIAIASGGGVQAIWRLETPVELGGDPDKVADFERYGLQLEILFSGDHCRNVDRILRLPGTVNWPKEAKRKRGRVPAMASLLWFEPTSYPLRAFKQAASVQGPAASPGRPRAAAPGNVKRIAGTDELGERVSSTTKMLIVQGRDTVGDAQHQSRSEVLFRVVCDLVRADVSDEVIYSVITDPDLGISSSVLDKGSQAQRYALRQIDRARDHAVDPALAELNERHAVVANHGGRCRVIEEVEEEFGRGNAKQKRKRLTFQAFDDFKGRYMNRRVVVSKIEGKEQTMPLGAWWLAHEKRRQYETIGFHPSGDRQGVYNLWRGFSVDARPGSDHEPWLEHVRANVCRGDDDCYRYLIGWMATCVQSPDGPGEVAVVLRGRQGTGKGRFATTFGRLWGRHFLHVSNAKHLVGHFNGHLRDCVVLFADEAFYAGDKQHESILKTLITEDTLMVETKGVDAAIAPSFLHLIMSSNNDWVVPAGPDERRFFVLDVGEDRMQQHEYHARYIAALEGGGFGHLLHFLQGYDLSRFDVRKVPKTEALAEQKQLSFTSEQEWWYHHLQDGVLVRGHPHWTTPVPRDAVLDDYLMYAQKVGTFRRANATSFGRFMKKVVPRLRGGQRIRSQRNEIGVRVESRAYYYEFPSLAECRADFDRACGGPFEWQDVGDGDTTPMRAPEELF